MKKILITGSLGQIGSELVVKLNELYGEENVVPTDIRMVEENKVCHHPNFEVLDVLDMDAFISVAKRHEVDTLIHMAALLSAVAEEKPLAAWDINMQGLINGLEVARTLKLQFFTPSSIGAFGPDTPKVGTPQDTIQRPTTMYGVTKVAGELLCDYYYTRFGVDTRGVRFPGLISYVTPPGGGTTDYAVQIYYDAIKYGKYVCNIPQGVKMDMMYMPDAIQAIIDLMEADADKLVHRNAFNISGMSFEPEEIAASIRKVMPDFEMTYDVNPTLERIAKSWPDEMDISAAKEEWNFKAEYDLDKMTVDMLEKLKEKL
ncbi:L-threonine 3-dehydrogenase [Facklamia sp. 7083-14-GEN3]|uniref:L-threonine 3-dehydrogenase n=1 Tax=Facklamia sp. 7083-14-GEN3 TaxID=2973478 RepID=UPI00215D1626|nr:L-threonine 3-dehydrogenase [Facklamia sp. 7083-14-GEN3]MCR8969186.1 L-threonine 3-dehydrogenase [Facklamia sp. 7083-14-GEN3]